MQKHLLPSKSQRIQIATGVLKRKSATENLLYLERISATFYNCFFWQQDASQIQFMVLLPTQADT